MALDVEEGWLAGVGASRWLGAYSEGIPRLTGEMTTGVFGLAGFGHWIAQYGKLGAGFGWCFGLLHH